MESVHRSLTYISEHGSLADAKSVKAVVKVFNQTEDGQTRQLCLKGLMLIANKAAIRELTQISQNEGIDSRWRQLSAQYLNSLTTPNPKSAATSSLVGSR